MTFAEAAPDHIAGQTEFVQPLRPKAADPGREHRALPGGRGQFEALQAPEYLSQASLAVEGVARRHVLPAGEEPHEVADGHRLDLTPQAVEREPVDAGQEAAIADVLDIRVPETAGEDEATGL